MFLLFQCKHAFLVEPLVDVEFVWVVTKLFLGDLVATRRVNRLRTLD